MKDKSSKQVKFWRVKNLNNLEILRGRFINQSFRRHSHDTFCIGLNESGIIKQFQKGSNFIIPPRSILLCNVDEPHAPCADENGFSYSMCYPSCQLMEKIVFDITGKIKLPFFSQGYAQDPEVATKLYNLFIELEKKESSDADELLYAILRILIMRYSYNFSDVPKVISDKSTINKILEYVEANYLEPICLEKLSKVTEHKLDPIRVCREFSKHMNMTLGAYRVSVRINKSKPLLRSGMSILAVALSVGFCDQQEFSKQFKRTLGITPLDFQKGCL